MKTNDPSDCGERPDGWPVPLRGVTESIVATYGPNDRWNMAALGLHAPIAPDEPVTATTWGNTRTKRNFHRQNSGVIQFTDDPREFVAAAATIYEQPEPVLDASHAWVAVEATPIDQGTDGGTEWIKWELQPDVEGATVRSTVVPTINRGFGAVIDATVAASRLDVPAFETAVLLDRLEYFAETVEKCGGPTEKEAFDHLTEVSEWRSYDRK
ncbi:DUF447 domain-containing protein [Natronocalculus amylovorans]|uniref:DUF447 family protein n=1 Tax=Natronocalculus amylovorans TaxID=2917812 RepID=A0AAE3FVA0_9EURY|nr:DUF447 domain-containing protein [Natronocalculus amylovorans]MCL9816212.1 DUF447 family protein [Natronocalculus amylovorans]